MAPEKEYVNKIKNKAGLAQLVEHLNRNQRVKGSNPLAGIDIFYFFQLKILTSSKKLVIMKSVVN